MRHIQYNSVINNLFGVVCDNDTSTTKHNNCAQHVIAMSDVDIYLS